MIGTEGPICLEQIAAAQPHKNDIDPAGMIQSGIGDLLTTLFRRVYYLATLCRIVQSFFIPLPTQFNIHSFRLHMQTCTVGRFVYVNAC